MMSLLRADIKTIVDPFCGSGTIPLYARKMYPTAQIYSYDRSSECIKGTIANFQANFELKNIMIEKRNFETISDVLGGDCIDAIVTDPPFGMKMGNKIKWSRFYLQLLGVSRKVLKKEGVLVLRLIRKEAFLVELEKIKGMTLVSEFEIDMKNFNAYILKIKKTS